MKFANHRALLGLASVVSLAACDLSTQVSQAIDSAAAALKISNSIQVVSMTPAISGHDIDPTTRTLAINMVMPSPPLQQVDFTGLVRVRDSKHYLAIDEYGLDNNGTTLLVHLAEPLAAKTTYAVLVSKKLLDSGAHHLKANFTARFVTGAELAGVAPAPVVSPAPSLLAAPTTASVDTCLNIYSPDDNNASRAPFSSTDCTNLPQLAKVYVHPNGNDGNPGTFDAPVQTLGGARDRAIAAMAASPQGVAILLRGDCAGGCTYTVLDPVVIEPMAAPLLIKSVLGPVHFSGGISFGEGNGGRWSDDVIHVATAGDDGINGTAAVKKFTFDDPVRQLLWARRALGANNGKYLVNQMFRDGQRLKRSTLTDSRFGMSHLGLQGDQRQVVGVTAIVHPENINIEAGKTEIAYDWKWQHARGQLTSWTPAKKKFTALVNIDPNSQLFKQKSKGAEARALLENNLAFVDTPGEWFLDEDSVPMALYYRPQVGENVLSGTFTMPISQQIFKLRGRSKTDVVHDVYFDGTEGGMFVEYTNWKYQNHVSEKSYGGGQQAIPADGALDANYVERVAVKNLTFQHYGSHGMRFGASRNYTDMNFDMSYAQNVTLFNNVFFDGGGGAIVFDSLGNLASNTRILSNRIQDMGKVLFDSDGITVENTSRSWVAFNQIVGTSYTGIGVGDRCPLNLDDRQDVYNNTIDDTMRVLDDGGGIYLHTGFGVVRNNVISGSGKNAVYKAFPHHTLWDLYFDEVAFFWRAIGNTIPRTFLVKSHSITYSANIGVKSPKYLDSATGSDALSQCSADLRHAPSWWTSGN